MTQLRLALLQTDIAWHAPEKNRAQMGEALSCLADVDLVLLPEMFTTGFSMSPELMAEEHPGPSLAWLQGQAGRLDAAVAGSVMVRDGGRHFNRLYFVMPDGSFCTYDKRHLFRMSDEHLHYAAGKERLILQWRGWRICPQICYDLRFPVFSRNCLNDENKSYDLLLYLASWPTERHRHWETLLRARAIENLSFVAAVNRTGTDDNQLHYTGGSALINFDGETLPLQQNGPHLLQGELDLGQLQAWRRAFPAQLDQDSFRLLNEAGPG